MQPPPLGCVATERFLVQVHFGLRVQDHASFVTRDLILSWSSCYKRDKMHTASYILNQIYVLYLHSCRKKVSRYIRLFLPVFDSIEYMFVTARIPWWGFTYPKWYMSHRLRTAVLNKLGPITNQVFFSRMHESQCGFLKTFVQPYPAIWHTVQ